MTTYATPLAPIPRLLARRLAILRALAVVALAGVMAASSYAEVPMWPVPITLQTLALFAIAGLAGMRMSFETVLVWFILASLGLPVLAGGTGGPEVFTGPTAGYLIGMMIAAPLAGGVAERTQSWRGLIGAFLVGHGIIIAGGWAWLAGTLGPARAFAGGVEPFLAGAVLKSLLAAVIVRLATYRRKTVPA